MAGSLNEPKKEKNPVKEESAKFSHVGNLQRQMKRMVLSNNVNVKITALGDIEAIIFCGIPMVEKVGYS